MPLNASDLAAEVALAIKSAVGPIAERLAAAEARLAELPVHVKTVGELRERMVVVETKAAVPIPDSQLAAPSRVVDLSPVLERLAAAEARLDVLGDLRDRVVVVETKAAQPVVIPTVEPPAPVDVSDVRERLSAVELKLELIPSVQRSMTSTVADLTKDFGAIRERMAVVETRPQPIGAKGDPGDPGKDGADGLGWDDLAVSQVDERTFTVKCMKGLQVKELGTLTFPVEIYRGVYVEGKSYDRGDGVTWGGSEWHCNETTTTKPGDGSKAWTLKVKRGRDGRDGTNGSQPPPVVSIGKR